MSYIFHDTIKYKNNNSHDIYDDDNNGIGIAMIIIIRYAIKAEWNLITKIMLNEIIRILC